MEQFFEIVLAWLQNLTVEHGLKVIATVLPFIGATVGSAYLARRAWRSREFLQRVMCTVNGIHEGTLKIRTIFEMELGEVLLGNKEAVRLVLKGAKRTTVENPFIRIPGADHWYVLNAMLNEMAERFNDGTIAADMGLPVHREIYIFGITCERDKDVRTRKIRIMLIKQSLLLGELSNIDRTEPTYESPTHRVRWNTLRQMAWFYAIDPSNFMKIEIVHPVLGVPSSHKNLENPAAGDNGLATETKEQTKATDAALA